MHLFSTPHHLILKKLIVNYIWDRNQAHTNESTRRGRRAGKKNHVREKGFAEAVSSSETG